jgi:uncharacterized tellurite resistance protein B-like protein
MELSDLTRDERVALVALLELVVESDATASDDELKELQRVIDAVGEAAYAEAAGEADERFHDEADLKAFLPSITRQEARELIYGAVLETALPDAMGAHESAMLEWLGKAWGIAVHIEESGSGGNA